MVHIELPEIVETSRLYLHRLRYEDAEEIFYCYASKAEATRFMSWATHQAIDDTRAFVRFAIHSWELGIDFTYAIRLKESGRLVGSFGIIHEDGKVQFGYIFSPTQWGNGYATETCQKMMSLLKEQSKLYRIGTFVDVDNKASANVLRKSGLIQEAILPKWFRFVNQKGTAKDCILFRLPLG